MRPPRGKLLPLLLLLQKLTVLPLLLVVLLAMFVLLLDSHGLYQQHQQQKQQMLWVRSSRVELVLLLLLLLLQVPQGFAAAVGQQQVVAAAAAVGQRKQQPSPDTRERRAISLSPFCLYLFLSLLVCPPSVQTQGAPPPLGAPQPLGAPTAAAEPLGVPCLGRQQQEAFHLLLLNRLVWQLLQQLPAAATAFGGPCWTWASWGPPWSCCSNLLLAIISTA